MFPEHRKRWKLPSSIKNASIILISKYVRIFMKIHRQRLGRMYSNKRSISFMFTEGKNHKYKESK